MEDAVDKRCFPSAFVDEGGVQLSYVPMDEEMENCAFPQRAGIECPRLKEASANCGNCIHQKTAIKSMFVKESRIK